MCLAVPAQIISLDGMTAVAEMSGIKKEIDVTLTPEVPPATGWWYMLVMPYSELILRKLWKRLKQCAPLEA